jgi:hypothetical protein
MRTFSFSARKSVLIFPSDRSQCWQISTILNAVNDQLAGFRIFVADIGTEPRILERLEAAIMNNLYEQPPPLCDIPDKGMMLAPRWDSEEPIITEIKCEANLQGLPKQLVI